ncbi:MAG: hypothetical protein IJL30_03705 [Clostridia bacterium]|nr:hypothetical protein [Clostridia bacterium]
MDMKENQIIACPMPDGKIIAKGYYNSGPMLKDDTNGPTDEDSRMQIVCSVKKEDFEKYIEKIKSSGARIYLENSMVDDRCIGFEYNNKQYHAVYWAKRSEIRIIEDQSPLSLDRFAYSDTGDRKTLLYAYGLYYDPANGGGINTINCGMVYIVRLSDGSLFVVDGGYVFQHSKEANDALFKFMYDLADKREDGKIRISCWYFTHGHDDHTDGCTRILDRFHDKIILERVMHGFQSRSICRGFSPAYLDMKEAVSEYYPDVKTLKMHTGQKFSLSDMTVEVLYAAEDMISADALDFWPLRDFNSTSTIVKLTINGQRFMLLGDTSSEAEEFTEKYGNPELWKAEMVQVAHHCFNNLPKMYEWISAPVASVPNRFYGAHAYDNIHKLREVLKYTKENQVYYNGDATYEFEATKNGFVKTASFPVIGKEFDMSWSHKHKV